MIDLLQEDPVNLAGVAVHVQPAQATSIAQRIASLEGVEVHLIGAQGQLVVTVEEPPGERCLVERIHQLNQLAGVISTSLIYSHSDDALISSQETHHETD